MKTVCVKANFLPDEWISTTGYSSDNFFDKITNNEICWQERSLAETDKSYRQIIPYILVRNYSGQFLCYPRHGSEQRLNGLYSFGLGGHIDETDRKCILQQTVEACLVRELTEELTNYNPSRLMINYQGIINEIESEVGCVHLGLVYLAQCDEDYIPLPAEETKGATWKTYNEIKTIKKELWSDLAFRLISSKNWISDI
jgi:predicted NUDIX family phosphoesterase